MADKKATGPDKETEFKPSDQLLAGHAATGTVGLPKQGTAIGSEPTSPSGPHGEPEDDSDEDGDKDEG